MYLNVFLQIKGNWNWDWNEDVNIRVVYDVIALKPNSHIIIIHYQTLKYWKE